MIFKCKMCGGDLEIKGNSTVCECEYCGTMQTLPKIDDDRRANLYDRANHFRRNNEFDKAMGIYEQILNDDGSDAEAYWSLVLCRYGIEYVEDPTTHKRVPTVNRAQFTSIFDDANYQSAIEYADVAQRKIYKAEAETINEIQKGILEISSREEPFDVFICYKETDNSGRRTPDSVLANELYHQLTQEGFKVFFARITLEDKLGIAYEPYIFAALNSAKVMVVLGTKPEYFNAVWVKNEWSRYLALIKSGAKKKLIPAYKDMDPYDLPEEFSHLQAQDMAKLGFMQDLIRGIKKIADVDEPKVIKQENVVVQNESNSNITALLKRAKMALEDGEFSKADDFCEQVLNQDAENAEAYLYKLYAEFKFSTHDRFRTTEKEVETIKNSKNFAKAYRFGKQAQLDEDINEIIYNQASKLEEIADSEKEYNDAAKCFSKICGYKDAALRSDGCLNKGKEYVYQIAEKVFKNAGNEETYNKVAELYRHISGYKDADEKRNLCVEKALKCNKEDKYNRANNNIKQDTIDSLNQAITILSSIVDWKDSLKKLDQCRRRIAEKEEEQRSRAEKAEQERLAAEKKAQRKKKITIIASGIVSTVIVAVIIIKFGIMPPIKYNKAVSLEESGEYDEAINAFTELGNYKDSVQKISDIENYKNALSLLESGSYTDAISIFSQIKEFKDSNEKMTNCIEYMKIIRESLPFCTISAANGHTVGLKSDGTVVAVGKSNYDISGWTDIAAVSAGYGYTVGLKSDGTVVAVGYNKFGQCDVSGWTDIVAVSAGNNHTIGLKSDGTVVAVGYDKSGQCDVSGWTDIVAVSAGNNHTIGLKSDGTVVAVGYDKSGQCDVSGWTDIVAVSAGNNRTIGLKSDGTVVAVGYNESGQCDVLDWKNIVAVSAGYGYTVGLKSDGTVVAVGSNKSGQRYVSGWTDIVAVSAGYGYTVGLKSDGTVVAVGSNEFDVSSWTDIAVHN